MKRVLIKNVAIMLATVAISTCFVACDNTPTNNSTPSSQNLEQNYKVTFHYGFTVYNEDYTKMDYTKTTALTSKNGKKVTVSNNLLSAFEVKGYSISGYSSDLWKNDGIKEDLDVYVLYQPLQTFEITFKNADGSDIKTVSVFEGDTLDASLYPDTKDVVVKYMDLLDTSGYVSFGDGYIKNTDVEKAKNSVTVTKGYYFANWDKSAADVSQNLVITALEKKADGFIEKGNQHITCDGVKNDSENYVYMGSLKHSIIQSGRGEKTGFYENESDWQKAATPNKGTKPLDAELYMAWDGNYIYAYVEVQDEFVISNGREYQKLLNPWKQDGVELWYSLDGTYHKIRIDAFGYDVGSSTTDGNGISGYLDHIKDNKLFGTRLIGDNNLNNYKQDGSPKLSATATGYAVEFALPSYSEPLDGELANTPGGNNWGSKLNEGSKFYMSLQVDSISAVDTEWINRSIEKNDYKQEPSKTNKTNVDLSAYGTQMKNAAAERYWTFVLC